MGVTIKWENEAQTLISYCFEGELTHDETYRALDAGYAMLDAKPHRVDIVIDCRGITRVANNLHALSGHIAKNRRPNVGILVVITSNGLIKNIASLFMQLRPDMAPFCFVADKQAAIAKIRDHRADHA